MNKTAVFQETVWEYFSKHARDMPWRQPEVDGSYDPYKIMVSEIMLQQTQVPRVIPKYKAFLQLFPTVRALAEASLGEVLIAWSGLGYNRRAKFLYQAAQYIHSEYNDEFPEALNMLIKLPGVGHNTASAILTYAYNQRQVFVETNIRTVYIYHFFPERTVVLDTEILEMVERTIPRDNSTAGLSYRDFYWALMDYGVHLKKTVGNVSRASKHYTKQSKFEGSMRQVRGQVLKLLITGPQSNRELSINIPDERLQSVLHDLLAEQLIIEQASKLQLQ